MVRRSKSLPDSDASEHAAAAAELNDFLSSRSGQFFFINYVDFESEKFHIADRVGIESINFLRWKRYVDLGKLIWIDIEPSTNAYILK